MPLLDHFRPPWKAAAPWESIGGAWVAAVMRALNRTLPSEGYRAFMNVHLGHMIEADVAEFESAERVEAPPMPATGSPRTALLPEPSLTFHPNFPDEFEVRIKTTRDEMRLVAVIEFISPGNKDREEAREKFLDKCVGYLQLGIGLILVDTITNRHANLHNELLDRLAGPRVKRMEDTPIYVSSWRPDGFEAVESLDLWPYPLAVGQPIPPVPLPLKNGPEIMIDLETTYMQALDDHNLSPTDTP